MVAPLAARRRLAPTAPVTGALLAPVLWTRDVLALLGFYGVLFVTRVPPVKSLLAWASATLVPERAKRASLPLRFLCFAAKCIEQPPLYRSLMQRSAPASLWPALRNESRLLVSEGAFVPPVDLADVDTLERVGLQELSRANADSGRPLVLAFGSCS